MGPGSGLDERSLEWLHLLPADARLAVEGGSPRLHELLHERVRPHPTVFVGWGLSGPQLPPTNAYEAMVLINSAGASARQFRALGFACTLSFTALPSLRNTRVFAPLDSRRAAASALDFIALQRPVARLQRALSVQAARLGQLGRIGDRVLVARHRESDFEHWVRDATGTRTVYLAIAPGAISHKRKLTIQVTARDGHVLGFAKLASLPAAREATERECSWLTELARHGTLAGRVPRLLASATLADAFVCLVSPGPRHAAGGSFATPHWEFLEALSATTGRLMEFPQSRMWGNLQDLLQVLEPRLPTAWRSRARATLEGLRTTFGGAPLRLSLAHRDFQPGNMRQDRHGKLFVYDWEGAQAESTPFYDFFNFTFLSSIRQGAPRADVVARVLAAARAWRRSSVDEPLLPTFLAAYLIDHALRRLTNSDVGRDARSVFVLDTIADVLDHQGTWLGGRA